MMVSFVLSFFPRDVLDEILNLIESVSEDFPSYFSSRNKSFIPFEDVNVYGSTTTSTVDVLGKWKSEFSNLFNSYHCENDDGNSSHDQVSDLISSCPLLEDNISILEVKKAVDIAKRGKACGFDNIPSEVLHNDSTVYFLHVLFNVCLNKGIVPSVWEKMYN